MATCECLDTCLFFTRAMTDMPGTADMFRCRYCYGDNSQCARYMVYKAPGNIEVPANLFPNQRDRVKQIIEGR